MCVFVFVSFHGENRVKRGKENVRSGCLFTTRTLSNVFECIFSQIWRRKKKTEIKIVCKFWAARQPLAFVRGGFEKIILRYFSSHDAGRPGALACFPNTFFPLSCLPKNRE